MANVPVALIPDTSGGAGPEVFIDWQRFLYLAGEPWSHSDDDSARKLWRTRVERFVAEGYRLASNSSEADAGDTWEITHIQRGGLHVRASARFCRAVGLSPTQGELRAALRLPSDSRLPHSLIGARLSGPSIPIGGRSIPIPGPFIPIFPTQLM